AARAVAPRSHRARYPDADRGRGARGSHPACLRRSAPRSVSTRPAGQAPGLPPAPRGSTASELDRRNGVELAQRSSLDDYFLPRAFAIFALLTLSSSSCFTASVFAVSSAAAFK